MRIWKEFCFEAAHRLPNLPPAHKCSRLHGHSYRFRLHVTGEPDPVTGWVVDFGGLLRAAGDLILTELDHRYLNDIAGLENPTAELLAKWIWDRASLTVLPMHAVEVSETCTSGVWYEGPSTKRTTPPVPMERTATDIVLGLHPQEDDDDDDDEDGDKEYERWEET